MNFVPLSRVADIQLGKMLSPKAKTGKTPFPYLRNQNVQWGQVNLADLATMDFSDREREKYEPGRCAVWTYERTSCYFQKAIHRVRPFNGVADSEFLSLWIRYQAHIGAFEDQNAKTTIAHLPLVRLEQLLVPDFSVDRQRDLAAQLKAQLVSVEAASNSLQIQMYDVKRLVSMILDEVFAETENAKLVKIGDVAQTKSGTTPSRSRKDYWEPPKHPWVKTGEVAFNPIRQTEELISEKALRECSLSLLPPDTVLVAMYGQGKTRGQSAVLEVAATTNQACFAILPTEHFDPQYLQFWLRRSYEALRTQSEARGGNQSNLNGAILNDFEIPLIPLARQRAIAKRIKLALAEAEVLQRAFAQQQRDIELLGQRLLSQAFNNSSEPTHD